MMKNNKMNKNSEDSIKSEKLWTAIYRHCTIEEVSNFVLEKHIPTFKRKAFFDEVLKKVLKISEHAQHDGDVYCKGKSVRKTRNLETPDDDTLSFLLNCLESLPNEFNSESVIIFETREKDKKYSVTSEYTLKELIKNSINETWEEYVKDTQYFKDQKFLDKHFEDTAKDLARLKLREIGRTFENIMRDFRTFQKTQNFKGKEKLVKEISFLNNQIKEMRSDWSTTFLTPYKIILGESFGAFFEEKKECEKKIIKNIEYEIEHREKELELLNQNVQTSQDNGKTSQNKNVMPILWTGTKEQLTILINGLEGIKTIGKEKLYAQFKGHLKDENGDIIDTSDFSKRYDKILKHEGKRRKKWEQIDGVIKETDK